MFKRRTPEQPAAPEPAAPAPPVKPGGKGRPTPKRRDAERRRGPVPPPPTNRREAAQRMRAETKERRARVRDATRRGDDRYLSPRDAGPVRRLVRDIVDSRRNAGRLFLPAALIFFAGQTVRSPAVQALTYSVWLFSLLLMIGDSVAIGMRIKRTVRERFGDDHGDRMRGLIFYGVTRGTVFRKWRLPPPRVQVGDPV